jgi:hypothetical protein
MKAPADPPGFASRLKINDDIPNQGGMADQ